MITLDSIAYKKSNDLDNKFNDYQLKNLCFDIKFASYSNMPKSFSICAKSYNTIDSCRQINDKLSKISILPDQKGL